MRRRPMLLVCGVKVGRIRALCSAPRHQSWSFLFEALRSKRIQYRRLGKMGESVSSRWVSSLCRDFAHVIAGLAACG